MVEADEEEDSGGDATVLEPREMGTESTRILAPMTTLNSAVEPPVARQKRKAETEELANLLYNGNFDAWLKEEKKKWRQIRLARRTERELLDGVRWVHQRAPQMEQMGEGLVRSAMLAQYERDLAKPPVMAAALRNNE